MVDDAMMKAVVAAVAMAVRNWTDAELATMNLAAQLGTDPRGKRGHGKVVEARLIHPDAKAFSPEIRRGLAWAVERRGLGTAKEND